MELLKNTVTQYTLLSDCTYSQEETLETIVPDVNPDVLRIICASSELCIKEQSVQTGKVRISGEVHSRIFYTAEGDPCIWQVEGSTPFSCTADIPQALPDDTLIVSGNAVGAQAVMLNPRKLSVKTQYCIRIQLYRCETLSFVSGAECDGDEDIHTQVSTITPLFLVGIPQRRLVINEEIRLSGGASAADRLYRSEISWVTEDLKVLTNKIMIRGSVCVKATTLAGKDTGLSQHSYNLPFAQIIKSDNTDVGDLVDISYQLLCADVRLAAGADGAPVLQCSITACAQAFVRRPIPMQVLSDLYSTAFESEMETETLCVCTGMQSRNTAASFSETVQTDYPAVRVHDVAVCCECRTPCAGDESLSGWICFQILYETTTGGLCCMNRKISLEAQADFCLAAGASAQLECTDLQTACTEEGSLCLSGKGVFRCSLPEADSCCQVKSFQLNRQNVKQRPRRGTLILRAYGSGDTVWQLAKKYGASPEAILSANKVSSENELAPGKLIIIPFSR